VAQAGAVVFDYTSISKRLFEAVNSKTIDFEGQVPGSSDRYHSYASHGDEAEPTTGEDTCMTTSTPANPPWTTWYGSKHRYKYKAGIQVTDDFAGLSEAEANVRYETRRLVKEERNGILSEIVPDNRVVAREEAEHALVVAIVHGPECLSTGAGDMHPVRVGVVDEVRPEQRSAAGSAWTR
jgi:bacillopeptidase F (M6 metalloprotease family)